MKGHLVSDGPHWQSATADATPRPAARRNSPALWSAAGSGRHFSLRSDDFGGLVGLVGVAQNVRGGRIDVSGTAVDDGPRRRLKLEAEEDDYPPRQRADAGENFCRSRRSPGILSGSSPGDGIPFSQLTAHVLYGTDRMKVEDFRAYGSVIGVNASGPVDCQDTRTIDHRRAR